VRIALLGRTLGTLVFWCVQNSLYIVLVLITGQEECDIYAMFMVYSGWPLRELLRIPSETSSLDKYGPIAKFASESSIDATYSSGSALLGAPNYIRTHKYLIP
jgi:hypothetical protein